jgi:hypothetical protein
MHNNAKQNCSDFIFFFVIVYFWRKGVEGFLNFVITNVTLILNFGNIGNDNIKVIIW